MGMNTLNSAEEIEDLELSDCENWAIDDAAITTAPGYVQNDDAVNTGPYWGIFAFNDSSGVPHIIRQRKTVLEYATDELGTNWAACTVPNALTQKQPTWAVLNGIVFYSNGIEAVMSSSDNGVTWVNRAGLPKSEVIANNGANRIIFTVQPASRFRIDWSNLNDGLTIGASSYQLIDPNNGEEIIGFGRTPKGTNIIFKRNSLFEISTYVDNGIVDVNFVGIAGCVGHHTIATTQDSIIWTGLTIIYELRDGVISIINGKISPLIRNNSLQTQLYSAVFYNRKYHLSMPDSDVSQDYNSQEYIIYKNLSRGDPLQPYPITRNQRYFGCYHFQDAQFSYGRDIPCFVGDSRTDSDVTTPGDNSIFAFINDFRDTSFSGGLNGAVQPTFFVTKYFTEDVPYWVKHYRKLFMLLKVTQNISVTIGYRFLPYGAFTEITDSLTAGDMEMTYDDATTGQFSEGFGFSEQREGAIFHAIENEEKPRGIQFRVSTNEVDDVQIFEMSYIYRLRPKFK
jgi:hypothetical protein